MPSMNPDAEAALEQATIELFAELGWETINAYHETFGSGGTLGRDRRGGAGIRAVLRLRS